MVGRDDPSPVDIKLSIYDSDGTTLIAYDDGDPMASATPGSDSYRTMVNNSHLTLNLPAGTYYMKVESHGNYADLGKYIVRVDRMMDGWQSEDIGLVYSPGFTDYDPTTGTFSVGGSGRGFGGTLASGGDGGQIAYTKLVGDGEIIARVASIENVTKDIRAGITMRESLATGSKFFSVYATPDMPGTSNDGHVAQQRRSSTDGNSSTQTASAAPTRAGLAEDQTRRQRVLRLLQHERHDLDRGEHDHADDCNGDGGVCGTRLHIRQRSRPPHK